MDLTPAERRRIYEEEKARIEAERRQVYGYPAVAGAPGASNPGKRGLLRTILIGLAVIVFIIVVVAGLVVSVVLPNLNKSKQFTHETAAIEHVKAIGMGQALYALTKGKGKFADLKTLANEDCIDVALGYGQRSGYLFTTTPINIPGLPPMYDTTARPISTGGLGTGNRSFGSNETYAIYEATGSVELRGTPNDRVPHGGSAIQ
jgi:hypothetical protein